MFDLLLIVSIFGTVVEAVKEVCTPAIPAENFANKELYHKDIINGVSIEQRMENIKNGKYKLTETYPEPHRNPQNEKLLSKIISYTMKMPINMEHGKHNDG